MSTKVIQSTSIIKMNNKLFIMAIMSSLLFFTGCSNEDTVETDSELEPYFQIFAEEAALRGFTVDYEAARIEGLLQDIPDSNVQGQCFRNEEKPRKVIVDREYWENADESQKQFIIFHELGHCFLNREHLDVSDINGTCLSIMHSSPGVCNFELNEDNRKDYLNELFFN